MIFNISGSVFLSGPPRFHPWRARLLWQSQKYRENKFSGVVPNLLTSPPDAPNPADLTSKTAGWVTELLLLGRSLLGRGGLLGRSLLGRSLLGRGGLLGRSLLGRSLGGGQGASPDTVGLGWFHSEFVVVVVFVGPTRRNDHVPRAGNEALLHVENRKKARKGFPARTIEPVRASRLARPPRKISKAHAVSTSPMNPTRHSTPRHSSVFAGSRL